jgi:hypothetical protein
MNECTHGLRISIPSHRSPDSDSNVVVEMLHSTGKWPAVLAVDEAGVDGEGDAGDVAGFV